MCFLSSDNKDGQPSVSSNHVCWSSGHVLSGNYQVTYSQKGVYLCLQLVFTSAVYFRLGVSSPLLSMVHVN